MALGRFALRAGFFAFLADFLAFFLVAGLRFLAGAAAGCSIIGLGAGDGGGPDGPHAGRAGRGDWLFAQAPGSPSRPPCYVDYLFLAFSTSASFSTTDTVPVTPKAKLLMMAQSLLSMTTLVVVASRAINILGS